MRPINQRMEDAVSSETTTGLSKVEVIKIDQTRIGEAAVEYVPAEVEFQIAVNGEVDFATTFFSPDPAQVIQQGRCSGTTSCA